MRIKKYTKGQIGPIDPGVARGIKTKRKGIFGRSTETMGKVNNGGDALRLDW